MLNFNLPWITFYDTKTKVNEKFNMNLVLIFIIKAGAIEYDIL